MKALRAPKKFGPLGDIRRGRWVDVIRAAPDGGTYLADCPMDCIGLIRSIRHLGLSGKQKKQKDGTGWLVTWQLKPALLNDGT